MKRFLSLAILLGSATLLLAHPHFTKSASIVLEGGDLEISINYYTVPSNETKAASTPVGTFVTPGRPTVKFSKELNPGSVSIPSGEYTLGTIKKSADNWVMALAPGGDTANLIQLPSHYSKSESTIDHLSIDVVPGHGDFEGKTTLMIGYGSMMLEGALD